MKRSKRMWWWVKTALAVPRVALAVYLVSLSGAFLLVFFCRLPPVLLYLFIVPILVSAVIFQRPIFLAMAIALLPAELVSILLSGNTLETVALVGLGVIWPTALGLGMGFFHQTRIRRQAEALITAEVIQRREAEGELAKVVERLELAISGAGQWLYDWDLESDRITLDGPLRTLLGSDTPEQPISRRNWMQKVHEEDRPVLEKAMIAALEQDQPLQAEYRLTQEGGAWLWVQERGRVVARGREGKPQRFSGILQDIDSRKRAEEELVQRDELARFFGALLQDSYQPFVVAYPDGRLVHWNPAYCELLGYPAEEMKGWNWIEGTPPEWRGGEEEILAILQAGGQPQRYEKEYWRKDGSRVPVELVVHQYQRGEGTDSYYYAFVIDISERKLAEEALRRQEEELQQLVQQAPIGIYRTTSEGRFLMANQALVEMAGFRSLKDLLAYNLERGQTEPPGQRARFKEQILRDGQVRGLEAVWNRPDGTHIVVRENARAVRGDDGQLLYYEGPAEDVSEERLRDEALRRQNATLLALQETALGLLNRLELRGLLQEIVNRACQLLGTPHSFLFLAVPGGQGLKMKVAGGRMRGYLEILYQPREGLTGQVFSSGQAMLAREFGTWPGRSRRIPAFRNQSVLAVPLRSEKEGTIGVLGLSFEDGQEVGEAELAILGQFASLASIAVDNAQLYTAAANELRQRQRTEDALRESEVKLRSLIEFSGDGVVLTDEKGAIIEWNRSQERITGIPPAEALGKLLWEVQSQLVGAKDKSERDAIRRELEGILRGEEIPASEMRDIPIHRPDGTPVIMQVTAFCVPTALGLRFGGISRDISAQRELTQAIEKARTDLLFSVSHEMKTPLMTLAASRELLAGLPIEARRAKEQEYEEIWRQSLRRLRVLVDNLVDSQRVQTTGLKLLREQVNLGDLVRQETLEMRPLAESRGITLQTELQHVPDAWLDPEAIQRLLGNLLTNAIKFSPRGGSVAVCLRSLDGLATLMVEDQGPGIPREEQSQLFQPFARAARAVRDGVQGTGLGLYVAKLLAEAHQGSIELQSESRHGTTIIVRLPLQGSPEGESPPVKPLPTGH
ncbi:MAG: PAS domain S-box protein [Coprothermobacterota bacterium]|nr:PAS domain S-box protein [Coprothermobacterota bacterium]